jgi:thymidylate kinase
MFARKGEHDPAHLEAERTRYRALAERMEAAVLVDASRPPDEVVRAVLEQAWQHQRTRLGGPS